MVKSSLKSPQSIPSPAVAEIKPVTEENIDEVERETIRKVTSAIVILESAIASWEALPNKPDDLKSKFRQYQFFRDALADWETKMLKSLDKNPDFPTRSERLWDFVRICRIYQKVTN